MRSRIKTFELAAWVTILIGVIGCSRTVEDASHGEEDEAITTVESSDASNVEKLDIANKIPILDDDLVSDAPEAIGEPLDPSDRVGAEAASATDEAIGAASAPAHLPFPSLPAGLSLPPFLTGPDGQALPSFRLKPSLRELGKEWEYGPSGQSDFSIPLPDGREVVIKVEKFVAIGGDGGEFTGTLEGFPGSSVNLSYRGGGEVGIIRIPSEGKVVRIFPGMDGGLVFVEDPEQPAGPEGLPRNLPFPGLPPSYEPIVPDMGDGR